MLTRSQVHASIQHLVDESFNKGNVEIIADWFSDDYANHPLEIGRAAYTRNTLDMRATLPDVHASTDLEVVEGNWLAYRFSVSGTFTNAYPAPQGPIPPNHKPLAFSMIIFRHQDDEGRMLEEWVCFDNLDFLTQMGVIPGEVHLTRFPAAQAAPGTAQAEAANKAAVRRVIDEVINGGNINLADELFDASYQYHPLGATLDLAAWKGNIEVNRAAFPDLKLTPETLIAEGNLVAMRFTMTGTFTHPIPNPDGSALAPNNGAINVPIGVIFRCTDANRIAEAWEIFDQITLLTQLGVLPAS